MKLALVLVMGLTLVACGVATDEEQLSVRSSTHSPVSELRTGSASTLQPLERPPTAELTSLARDFVAFARGDQASVPLSARVALLLGNQQLGTISDDAADDAEAWEVCPEVGYYAARTCPFSALQPFRDMPGPVALSSEPPDHPCAHPAALPTWLRALESVTLTPATERTCAEYVAVQLFVESGRIVAVNVVWAEP